MLKKIAYRTAAGIGKMATTIQLSPVQKHWQGLKINLDLEQFIDAKIFYFGTYEPDTLKTLYEVVRPGMRVIDVGANIGVLSLIFGKIVGPIGDVYAFEPSAWTFCRLIANLELNGMDWCHGERLAVWSKSDKCVQMVLPCGYRLDHADTATNQKVDVTTLDDYAKSNGLDRIDFIKTDTDGREAHVIEGAREIIAEFHPIIMLEFAPHQTEACSFTWRAPFDILDSYGYRYFDTTGSEANLEKIKAGILRYSDSVNILAMAEK